MDREINSLAEKYKDETIQIIYQAIEGFSREDAALLIYCAFEKFTRDIEARIDRLLDALEDQHDINKTLTDRLFILEANQHEITSEGRSLQ